MDVKVNAGYPAVADGTPNRGVSARSTLLCAVTALVVLVALMSAWSVFLASGLHRPVANSGVAERVAARANEGAERGTKASTPSTMPSRISPAPGIGVEVDSQAAQTHVSLTLALAIAAIGSCLLIFWIVAVRVVRPMSGLVDGAERIAQRAPDTVIPGVQRTDEFGILARALVQLQQHALISDRLEAQVQDIADADRQKMEMLRAEQVFHEALVNMIEAASAGDFSRRIDLSEVSGFSATLGEGLNRWAESINAALGQVSEVIGHLARGDLTKRMQGHYAGDLRRLQNDVNTMADELRAMVDRISHASGAAGDATREIGNGVADLSVRTEQQASALEETAASLEELAATVRQNAGNARQANEAALDARSRAVDGGAIADRAVAAMGKIDEASKQITDIVALIEEIAFQTNILALNAAVEAARAGEAGRGFAVVANEVRALAQRSGRALKDVKGLITDSNAKVKEGVGLVEQAGSSLTEIVISVKRVADLVSEITAASHEQSSGIDQVSRAVTNMDQMTQQNAALVEQTNSALHSARIQVDALRHALMFFVTDSERSTTSNSPESVSTTLGAASRMPKPIGIKARPVASRRGGASAALSAIDQDWKEF